MSDKKIMFDLSGSHDSGPNFQVHLNRAYAQRKLTFSND